MTKGETYRITYGKPKVVEAKLVSGPDRVLYFVGSSNEVVAISTSDILVAERI